MIYLTDDVGGKFRTKAHNLKFLKAGTYTSLQIQIIGLFNTVPFTSFLLDFFLRSTCLSVANLIRKSIDV